MKKVFFAAFFTCALLAARGEENPYQYLYWCVGDRGGYEFAGAALYAVNDDNSKTLISYETVPGNPDEDGNWAAVTASSLGGTTPGPVGNALIANITGYGPATSFYIELMNEVTVNGEKRMSTILTMGSPVTYDTLVQMEVIEGMAAGRPDGAMMVANSVWNPSGYVVPEPTSGLLLMMGAAVLALRRRRTGSLRS